jgi:hypothetical protein
VGRFENDRSWTYTKIEPTLGEALMTKNLIGSCTPSIKMAPTVSKFDDFARARLGPGPSPSIVLTFQA